MNSGIGQSDICRSQVDQDRSEGGPACPLHLIATGRGLLAEEPVYRYLEADSTTVSAGAGVTCCDQWQDDQGTW